jgi:putative endonuclease
MFGLNFIKRFRQRVPGPSHLALGEYGEQLVVDYLKRQGYRIVATNFTTPIGYSLQGRQVTGEVDIIAYDESARPSTLAFIEVKTRSSDEIAAPEAAVDIRKQRQIIRASRVYRRITAVLDEPYRYDVVSVMAKPNAEPEITLRRAYFSERRFSRSSWRARDF